jgi:hypothetical protein
VNQMVTVSPCATAVAKTSITIYIDNESLRNMRNLLLMNDGRVIKLRLANSQNHLLSSNYPLR